MKMVTFIEWPEICRRWAFSDLVVGVLVAGRMSLLTSASKQRPLATRDRYPYRSRLIEMFPVTPRQDEATVLMLTISPSPQMCAYDFLVQADQHVDHADALIELAQRLAQHRTCGHLLALRRMARPLVADVVS